MFRRLIRTKTFWAGLSAIATGAALCYRKEYETGITTIIAGLGAICMSHHVSKRKEKKTA